VVLVHLPDGRSAELVRDALVETVQRLPAHPTRSLTWDQGSEMAAHGSFTIATDMPVYFCDPASPWQRGSNENTNGLLRQYFPKGTDLTVRLANRCTSPISATKIAASTGPTPGTAWTAGSRDARPRRRLWPGRRPLRGQPEGGRCFPSEPDRNLEDHGCRP
jgi:hypothetical protein